MRTMAYQIRVVLSDLLRKFFYSVLSSENTNTEKLLQNSESERGRTRYYYSVPGHIRLGKMYETGKRFKENDRDVMDKRPVDTANVFVRLVRR